MCFVGEGEGGGGKVDFFFVSGREREKAIVNDGTLGEGRKDQKSCQKVRWRQ